MDWSEKQTLAQNVRSRHIVEARFITGSNKKLLLSFLSVFLTGDEPLGPKFYENEI